MSQYKLKPNQPDFEVVDGPLAGRKFAAGKVYTEIPSTEKTRFETVPDQIDQTDQLTKQTKKGVTTDA